MFFDDLIDPLPTNTEVVGNFLQRLSRSSHSKHFVAVSALFCQVALVVWFHIRDTSKLYAVRQALPNMPRLTSFRGSAMLRLVDYEYKQ